jgi:hypothetical protein
MTRAKTNWFLTGFAIMVSIFWSTTGRTQTPTGASAWRGRGYYLTPGAVQGNQPLTACASGYHMANMAEILNPSMLNYDTSKGFKTDDSGSGPPWSAQGWVRTGEASSSGAITGGGVANCKLWTDNTHANTGTVVWLSPSWGPLIEKSGTTTNDSPISPWTSRVVDASPPTPDQRSYCDQSFRVWCVQN